MLQKTKHLPARCQIKYASKPVMSFRSQKKIVMKVETFAVLQEVEKQNFKVKAS